MNTTSKAHISTMQKPGVRILPVACSCPTVTLSSCRAGRNRPYTSRYAEASCHISCSARSSRGSGEDRNAASTASTELKSSVRTMACFIMFRASSSRPPPTCWAVSTLNPMAAAMAKPLKSHVAEAISPTEADCAAPRRPTMAASINCITMVANCAMMAGQLSRSARPICCRVEIGAPLVSSSK